MTGSPRFVAEISLGSIVSIIAVLSSAVGVTLYISKIESGHAVNSARITSIEERVSRADALAGEAKREQADRLNRIENKIDSLLRESRASRN
jgi:hypothetical protein